MATIRFKGLFRRAIIDTEETEPSAYCSGSPSRGSLSYI